MAPLAQDLRRYVANAESVPKDQNKTEVRLYAALTTVGFMLLLIEPIFYLLKVPGSVVLRVASLTPSIWCVATPFILALLMTLPHLAALAFWPDQLWRRWPRRFSAYAAFLAAVTWIYLANLAMPLDAGAVEWAYVIRALGSIVIGLTYGFSLNAQLGRDLLKAIHAG